MPNWLNALKRWARALRRDATVLYLVTRDPRVPWYVKTLAALIAAYALSPLDLIPDFIPVVGYLDELVLLPLAIAGVMRLIDPAILVEHRAQAVRLGERPASKAGAAIVMVLWTFAIGALVWWLWR